MLPSFSHPHLSLSPSFPSSLSFPAPDSRRVGSIAEKEERGGGETREAPLAAKGDDLDQHSCLIVMSC